VKELVFTAAFPFCGLGAGALGFLRARIEMLGREARFRSVGGIDFDPEACTDFERFTDSPALCADIGRLTPREVRAFFGPTAPDVVFLSPPCKGASGLLSQKLAETEKYVEMNRLAETWTELMLRAWDTPPRLFLLENVPRLKTRAGPMVARVTALLRRAGMSVTDGFHCCGEIGGLAQRRRRILLVARHTKRVPALLYQPPRLRVRACGEVLGPLPMPGDPAGGAMHKLPRISWLNWVRLALIPAGGDWRDLPGVLAENEARRAKWKRHAVEDWSEPTGTVGGSGSNGVENVADPRPFGNVDRVTPWDQPTGTVTTSPAPSSGGGAVADPRVLGIKQNPNAHHNKYTINDWSEPTGTVIGATRPGSGAPSVADPRVRGWFNGVLGVVPWGEPTGTVTSSTRSPQAGANAVADPRVKTGFDHAYRVLRWEEPSFTVAGKSHPGCGAYAVGDPRLDEAMAFRSRDRSSTFGVIPWSEAAKTVTGESYPSNGAFAVADPRAPEGHQPVMIIRDIRKPPPGVPVILSEDGTWHRPLTTLELAVLQGLPEQWNGESLKLAGTSVSAWRERIGNAVPPPAGEAIATRMLVTLVQADAEAWALSSGDVWVQPEIQ
jgi:site-specific DNA-cytosine methylase